MNFKTCERCDGTGRQKVTNEYLRRFTPLSRYEWNQRRAGGDKLTWSERIARLDDELTVRLQNLSEHLHRHLKAAYEVD